MTGGDDQAVKEWSRDTLKIAVLSWISFLTASAFTVLFFAFVDPYVLVDALNISFVESRNAGYAIGFFSFWAHAWISGWFVLRLVRRKRTGPRKPGA
jgi:hypothetical protein